MTKDMKKVQEVPTETIQNYADSLQRPDAQNKRVHFDCDTAQMQDWLGAEKFPLGAWPSTYSLSLMQ